MDKKEWWKVSLIWLTGIVLFLFILYIAGFRITYSPDLENKWPAIEAIGTWAGVFSPIALAIINTIFARNIEKTKSEISLSNRVIYEQALKEKNETNISIEDLRKIIYDYITVAIACSTLDISKGTNIGIDRTYEVLLDMEGRGMINGINLRKGVNKEKVVWKRISN